MMTEHLETRRSAQELAPLTDSLASCIRWRLSDYEAVLRGEVELLLDADPGREAHDVSPEYAEDER